MSSCAVVIPIYKQHFNTDEIFSVKKSLSHLAGHDVYWVAPASLDIRAYQHMFGIDRVERFDDHYFANIAGYNRLLVSTLFYERFLNYEYMLICQPDAVVLKPELHIWLNKSYDYIGAPWPKGYSFTIQTKHIPIEEGVTCTAFVGNGGLSLRRNRACISLIQEFDDVSDNWHTHGHAEDLFFAFVGTLSQNFLLPNIMTAANFSHDIDPRYLQKLTNHQLPFGVHAWEKYERSFWESLPDWQS
jgi:Protein of unknown function (DUF5672)